MNPTAKWRVQPPSFLRGYAGAILLALLLSWTIRVFFLEAYRIPSLSMHPGLEPGDTVFVSKSAYGIRLPSDWGWLSGPRAPELGDVVVFREGADSPREFIKRIVALPGDQVQVRKGHLWINGRDLTSKANPDSLCGEEKLGNGRFYQVCWEPPLIDGFGPVQVPAGSVFVMGDQRTQTNDARGKPRGWGTISLKQLKGKALSIWLSIDPPGAGSSPSWFSRIRFERMFKKIL